MVARLGMNRDDMDDVVDVDFGEVSVVSAGVMDTSNRGDSTLTDGRCGVMMELMALALLPCPRVCCLFGSCCLIVCNNN